MRSQLSLSNRSSQYSTPAFHALLRYPHERRTLYLTLLAVAGVITLVSMISLGAAFLLVAFAVFSASTLVRLNHRQHVGNALRIGARQFPELAAQAARAARAVRVPPVQVFIYQDDKINAYAFGWSDPQVIALTSELVEAMDADEFRFVVGHEMGHIALGHTKLSTLVGGVLGAPSIPFLSNLFVPAFNWWRRCAEYSADRAGLIACGNLEKAVSAQIKLMVGPRLAKQVDLEQIVAQSQELSGRLDAMAGEAGASHPFLVHRVCELARFWNTEACQEIISEQEVSDAG